ncbi:MAG: FxsA family protein [Gammaproteobacteria bacterium]|nr:FxsA family protein [Gammaproteobacteria bacterium]
MRGFPVIAAFFIGVPLIEIYLFIQLGGIIGALPTVILVIVTALLGVSLLRAQGFSTMAKFQQEVSTGQLPATTMLEGVALIFGGALLLTPGFLTDAIGFLCLIPFTRRTIISWLIKNMTVTSSAAFYESRQSSKPRDTDVIEGEISKSDENSWKQK